MRGPRRHKSKYGPRVEPLFVRTRAARRVYEVLEVTDEGAVRIGMRVGAARSVVVRPDVLEPLCEASAELLAAAEAQKALCAEAQPFVPRPFPWAVT